MPPPPAGTSSNPQPAPPSLFPFAAAPSSTPFVMPATDAVRVVPLDPGDPSPIPNPSSNPARDVAREQQELLPGTWQLPGSPVPIKLPTPDRAIREGVELLRNWHPRDPLLRVKGEHRAVYREQQQAAGDAATTTGDPAGGDEPSTEDRNERSGAAKTAMMVGIGGGFTLNGLDVLRLLKKYPEALRAGQFDPSLGRLGRLPTAVGLTFLTRPDNRIVDPTAPLKPTVASLGRSFTKFDSVAMKASVLIGTSLAALQIGSAIPNLADALDNEGPWYQNLAQSTSGRAGILQLTGGLIGAGVFAAALRQTAGQGSGIVGRALAAGNAPIAAKPLWGRIGMVTGALVMANEVGYLDMFNADETRSTGQVLSDAVHRTPVLNDPTLRTGALLAAGGVVGFKASRAVAAAGIGIKGLPKGYWAAGAVVAGLLGTQLLGGLQGMNKPEDGK